jgi:drug/metabolite transporter (DMT)-like permease
MLATTAVSTIAQTIQLSVAPVFLLAGIGAILNVMAGRLGRVVDRARMLEQLHPKSTGPEHDRHVWELRLLDRRIAVINAAIFVIVMSAIAVCLLVALLFVAELTHLEIGNAVAIVFVLSMALLILSLALFLFEIRLALRSIRIRKELLERGARRTLR